MYLAIYAHKNWHYARVCRFREIQGAGIDNNRDREIGFLGSIGFRSVEGCLEHYC